MSNTNKVHPIPKELMSYYRLFSVIDGIDMIISTQATNFGHSDSNGIPVVLIKAIEQTIIKCNTFTINVIEYRQGYNQTKDHNHMIFFYDSNGKLVFDC